MKGLVLLVLALFALSTADFCTDLEAAFADVVAAKPENVIARLPPVGTDVPQTVDAYIAWVRQFFAWEPTVEQAAAIEAAVGTRWETIKYVLTLFGCHLLPFFSEQLLMVTLPFKLPLLRLVLYAITFLYFFF